MAWSLFYIFSSSLLSSPFFLFLILFVIYLLALSLVTLVRMALRERIFANPFKVEKHEDEGQEVDENAVDQSSPALRQPPATRAELWSYYLYYNGVSVELVTKTLSPSSTHPKFPL